MRFLTEMHDREVLEAAREALQRRGALAAYRGWIDDDDLRVARFVLVMNATPHSGALREIHSGVWDSWDDAHDWLSVQFNEPCSAWLLRGHPSRADALEWMADTPYLGHAWVLVDLRTGESWRTRCWVAADRAYDLEI